MPTTLLRNTYQTLLRHSRCRTSRLSSKHFMQDGNIQGEGEMVVAKSEGDGKEKLYVEKVF